MITNASDLIIPTRRSRTFGVLACGVLTIVAINLLGVGYQFQLLLVAVFAPLMFLSYARSTRLRQGDVNPTWLETSSPDRRKNPSGPSQNPLDFDSSKLAFDERITVVADLCRQFGRHVSVIHFQFHFSDRITLERAASALRAGVRKTDYVENIGAKEIVICLNMIRGLGEAELVMRRLSTALEKQHIDRAKWDAGCAMHPLHGYHGADLLSFARQICTTAVDNRKRRLSRGKSGPGGQDGGSGAAVATRLRVLRSSKSRANSKIAER